MFTLTAMLACGLPAPAPSDAQPKDEDRDASLMAAFVDMEFVGELETSSDAYTDSAIEQQLMYTVGQLNGDNSVGRLDNAVITDVQTEDLEDGGTRVRYNAVLPVAWGNRDSIPDTYTLELPRDLSYGGQDDFTEKYSHDCVSWGAHDVDSGSMWYYYRPNAYSCELDEADVNPAEATVSPSENVTSGKYPEYHKVYEDQTLQVLAVFGKYENGATTSADAGVAAYNEFVDAISGALEPYGLTTDPEDVPDDPGVEADDITFRGSMEDGTRIQVTALLIDSVRAADNDFDDRYADLSAEADLIAYNGHSGLGANIRALASKGTWVTGQYVMVFMNGCDTYAYVDDAILQAHVEVNEDDPIGTKYVDMITNAMPAYFHADSEATMAFVDGLLSKDEPRTYEEMFAQVDSSQVILVTGEEDNVFEPESDQDTEDTEEESEEG